MPPYSVDAIDPFYAENRPGLNFIPENWESDFVEMAILGRDYDYVVGLIRKSTSLSDSEIGEFCDDSYLSRILAKVETAVSTLWQAIIIVIRIQRKAKGIV